MIRVRRQLPATGGLVEPKTAAARRDVRSRPALGRMLTGASGGGARAWVGRAGLFVFAASGGAAGALVDRRRWSGACATRAAGLPHLSWHDLRHLAASAMIAIGVERGGGRGAGARASYLAITLGVYLHRSSVRKQADRTREAMELAFGSALGVLR